MDKQKKRFTSFISHIFISYSNIIFLKNARIGFFLFCLTLININVFFSGVLSIISLYIFVYITNQKAKIQDNIFIYNSLLWSMGVGFFFKLSPSLLLFIIVGSIFTFLITTIFNYFFVRYNIPLFSLPFALISTCTYIASLKYSQLFSLNNYSYNILWGIDSSHLFPDLITSFFVAWGYIFFIPNAIIGLVIFLVVLSCSRILAFCSIFTFIVGLSLKSLFISDFSEIMNNYYNFNYILTGLALGGIYFRVSLRMLFVTAVAVSMTMLSIDLFSGLSYSYLVFTLPFNLAVITIIFALRINHFGQYHYKVKETPEKSISLSLINQERFHIDDIVIGLPIMDEVVVLQAFDGEWTHKDDWRHAYDFVRHDENGKTFKGSGLELTDYYIYGASAVSPIEGWVVDIVDYVLDNTVGAVNKINNWGNYVIIQSRSGFCVEISHLIPYSIEVQKGQYVNYQQYIGLVGNSGYSAYPHLHVHVQESTNIGSPTSPFLINFYMSSNNRAYFNGILDVKQHLKAPEINYSLLTKYFFSLDMIYNFNVCEDNKSIGYLRMKVSRDSDSLGLGYLEDDLGSKLFFKHEKGIIYFYEYNLKKNSYLKYIYFAMPRIILSDENYNWEEKIPLEVSHSFCKRNVLSFLALFDFPIKFFRGKWYYNATSSIISGVINGENSTKISFDSNGIKEVSYNNISLKRL